MDEHPVPGRLLVRGITGPGELVGLVERGRLQGLRIAGATVAQPVGQRIMKAGDVQQLAYQLMTQKQIAEFLQSAAADKANAGKLLFAGLFDTLNGQRASVMNGLERVMRKQREAAEKIRDDTIKLQALQDATPPDQAKVDELGNQLVWETRIFEDRGRVVKFVCEVPTTIDQRLFALSRTIQQELD